LIALVIQPWLILVGCWGNVDRSLTKAAQTIRKFAFPLASVIGKTNCWDFSKISLKLMRMGRSARCVPTYTSENG